VLSVDVKSGIQALDRTQPLLPMTFGKTEKRTHDYVRVQARKTGHGALLPLPHEVGEALVDYLRGSRPATAARQVFVLHRLRPGAPRPGLSQGPRAYRNDMLLGSSPHRNGVRATMFTWKDKGIGHLVGDGADARIVRTVYLDGPACEHTRYGPQATGRRPGC
jgi:hypothetical protein